jgi:hypothetical protein
LKSSYRLLHGLDVSLAASNARKNLLAAVGNVTRYSSSSFFVGTMVLPPDKYIQRILNQKPNDLNDTAAAHPRRTWILSFYNSSRQSRTNDVEILVFLVDAFSLQDSRPVDHYPLWKFIAEPAPIETMHSLHLPVYVLYWLLHSSV